MFSKIFEELCDYTQGKLDRIKNEYEYALEAPDYIRIAKRKIKKELEIAKQNLELGFDDAQIVIDTAKKYLEDLKQKEKELKESLETYLWIVDIYGLTDNLPYYRKYTRAPSPEKALANIVFRMIKKFEDEKNLVYYKDGNFSVPITREKAGVLIDYLRNNPRLWKAVKLGEEIKVKEV